MRIPANLSKIVVRINSRTHINELRVVDKQGFNCDASSETRKGEWYEFDVQPNERICGIFGESFVNDEYEKLKNFGYIVKQLN